MPPDDPHSMNVLDGHRRESVIWTRPAEILAVVHRLWSKGQLLSARLTGESPFPLSIPLRRPRASVPEDRFDDARRWVASIQQGDREHLGFGYELTCVTIEHRRLGALRVPEYAVIPSELDALKLIGKDVESAPFDALSHKTLTLLPALRGWLIKHPLRVLKYSNLWDRLISLVAWFQQHPRPGIYVRQIPLPGIDANFIEQHRGLIGELLDEVLPTTDGSDARGSRIRGFEERYGLLAFPARVRFRVLDRHLAPVGLTDIEIPFSAFSALSLPARRIFITDSEANLLAFPELPDSIVLFRVPGLDDHLPEVPWLRDRASFYWGDISTTGFSQLDRLRAVLPGVRSFLMDRETLLAHKEAWVSESPTTTRSRVCRLTEDESALLEDLRHDRLGDRVLLEQERVTYNWFLSQLDRTVAGPSLNA